MKKKYFIMPITLYHLFVNLSIFKHNAIIPTISTVTVIANPSNIPITKSISFHLEFIKIYFFCTLFVNAQEIRYVHYRIFLCVFVSFYHPDYLIKAHIFSPFPNLHMLQNFSLNHVILRHFQHCLFHHIQPEPIADNI